MPNIQKIVLHASKILHTIYIRVIMTLVRNILKIFRDIFTIVTL